MYKWKLFNFNNLLIILQKIIPLHTFQNSQFTCRSNRMQQTGQTMKQPQLCASRNTKTMENLAGIELISESKQAIRLDEVEGIEDEVSVACFVKVSDKQGDEARLFCNNNSGRGCGFWYYENVYCPYIGVEKGYYAYKSLQVELPTDRYVHLVIVFGKSTKSVYVDGDLKASCKNDYPVLKSSNRIRIGCHPNDDCDFFNGCLEDFRVFKGELTASDIVKLSMGLQVECEGDQTQRPKCHLQMIAHLPLKQNIVEEVSGTTLSVKNKPEFKKDGKLGGGIEFKNEYKQSIKMSQIDGIEGAMSFSVFIKAGEKQENEAKIFDNSGSFKGCGFEFFKGHYCPFIGDGEENYVSLQGLAVDLPCDRYVHLAVVLGLREKCIYIDGELKVDGTNPRTILKSSNQMRIGCHHNDDRHFFNGCIEDFRIFKGVLLPEDVKRLANGEEVEDRTEDTIQNVFDEQTLDTLSQPAKQYASEVRKLIGQAGDNKSHVFTETRDVLDIAAAQLSLSSKIINEGENTQLKAAEKHSRDIKNQIDKLMEHNEKLLMQFEEQDYLITKVKVAVDSTANVGAKQLSLFFKALKEGQ